MYTKTFFLALLLGIGSHLSYATHIRGAEITYKRMSSESFTFEFTLTGYHDTGSPVYFGDGLINFGDDREVQIDLEASSFQDEVFIGHSNEFILFKITIVHTYANPGTYTVSYREPNRNDEIVNINHGNYQNIPFFVKSLVVIDPEVGVNNSPIFNTFPVDFGFVGRTFTHNPWAWDPDGDSLAYRLITPRKEGDTLVTNYQKPNDPEFYQAPLDWNFANEGGDGPALWQINPFTGDLTWDAPGNFIQNTVGPFSEYNVALIVEEWRKINGSWIRIGYVTRDFLIVVTPEEIGRPDFALPEQKILSLFETVQESITFEDPDGDLIKVEYFGEVFDLENGPMKITPVSGDFINGPVTLNFDWTPLVEHGRRRPYYVHLKVTDHPVQPDVSPSVTYKTWGLWLSGFPDVITDLTEIPESQTLKLYPNPATHLLKWRLPNEQLFSQLNINNSLGQQTISLDVTSTGIRELDVRNLPTGIYFVHLNSQQGRFTSKFIKQ